MIIPLNCNPFQFLAELIDVALGLLAQLRRVLA